MQEGTTGSLPPQRPRSVLLGAFLLLTLALEARAGSCPGSLLAVGTAAGAPGDRVSVEITGRVDCEVTGFSLAVGHDSSRVRFVEAMPGAFIRNHAGDDLVFHYDERNSEGYAVLYAFFDISSPITVPPAPIPDGTILATMVYEIRPTAGGGSTPLLNRTRTYGSPNRISNIYSAKPGEAPIEPDLLDGGITIEVGEFLRGDADFNAAVELADALRSLDFLFASGPLLPCLDAADADDDGEVDLSDPLFTLFYLFLDGPEPPLPGPLVSGPDPTHDNLDCMPP